MSTLNNKNILIYANSSQAIGAGHIMRQLGLAQALNSLGYQCVFIAHHCLEDIKNKILTLNFGLTMLPSEDFLPKAVLVDAAALIIDDYNVNQAQASDIASLSIPTIWFDDNVNNVQLVADIVINSAEHCQKIPRCMHLTGLNYRLIRPEFYTQRQTLPDFNQRKRVLISLGATDVKGINLSLVRRILEKLPNTPIDLVIGNAQVDESSLASLNNQYDLLTIHPFVDDMASLMAQAGLAVATAGGTLYELGCLGVPTIGLLITNNQAPIKRSTMINNGVTLFDLRQRPTPTEPIDSMLEQVAIQAASLWLNQKERLRQSRYLMAKLDGQGIHRVADTIDKSLKDITK